MEFKFKHCDTGRILTLSLSEEEMANLIDVDDLFDEFCKDKCKCESVGETNVIECGCEDYLNGFELQP